MKRIIIVVAVIIAASGGVWYYSKQLSAPYALATVKKGNIVQEVFASGKVEAPTRINLRFKNSGKMTVVRIKVGEEVEAGQILAEQDAAALEAQLSGMQAGVDFQKAKLAQSQAGASPEDIAVAETAVNNARANADNAAQSLNDARQNFVDKIQDAYTKADDAVRGKADKLFTNPLSSSPRLIFFTPDYSLQNDIERSRAFVESNDFYAWKPALDQLTIKSDLSVYASSTRKYLNDISSFLNIVSLALNNPSSLYTSSVGVGSSAIPDAWKTDISAARTNTNAALSGISAAEANMKAVQASLDVSRGNLNTAQNQLALKKAPVRATDIAVYEAQIQQAEAQMRQVRAQIQDMKITAPVAGIITVVSGNPGEIIDSGKVAVSMISGGAFQIKVNLSEDNVAGVKVGQPVRIVADALQDEWDGTVIDIDPSATIINGSVYYQTTAIFNEKNSRVKDGMTANVWIKTGEANNVLIVPASAIQKAIQNDSANAFARVYQDKKIINRNVVLGIKSQDGMVEIISGLSDGQQVITGNQ